jgi:YD repeat-containing protein
LISQTDPRGNVTRFEYDALDRRVAEIVDDPDGAGLLLGAATYFSYDFAGQLTSVRDPRNQVTQFGYDGLGRQTSVVDALGHESRTAYDAAGNVVSQTDANGNVTLYEYDRLNRLIAVTGADPDGPFGELASPVTSFFYDAAGQQTDESKGTFYFDGTIGGDLTIFQHRFPAFGTDQTACSSIGRSQAEGAQACLD